MVQSLLTCGLVRKDELGQLKATLGMEKQNQGRVYYFTTAAITKYHRLGGLNNRNLCLKVLVAKSLRTKVLAGLIPPEVLASWFVDSCLLSVFSHGLFCVCLHPWRLSVCPISSSNKDTSQIGLGLTLTASF